MPRISNDSKKRKSKKCTKYKNKLKERWDRSNNLEIKGFNENSFSNSNDEYHLVIDEECNNKKTAFQHQNLVNNEKSQSSSDDYERSPEETEAAHDLLSLSQSLPPLADPNVILYQVPSSNISLYSSELEEISSENIKNSSKTDKCINSLMETSKTTYYEIPSKEQSQIKAKEKHLDAKSNSPVDFRLNQEDSQQTSPLDFRLEQEESQNFDQNEYVEIRLAEESKIYQLEHPIDCRLFLVKESDIDAKSDVPLDFRLSPTTKDFQHHFSGISTSYELDKKTHYETFNFGSKDAETRQPISFNMIPEHEIFNQETSQNIITEENEAYNHNNSVYFPQENENFPNIFEPNKDNITLVDLRPGRQCESNFKFKNDKNQYHVLPELKSKLNNGYQKRDTVVFKNAQIIKNFEKSREINLNLAKYFVDSKQTKENYEYDKKKEPQVYIIDSSENNEYKQIHSIDTELGPSPMQSIEYELYPEKLPKKIENYKQELSSDKIIQSFPISVIQSNVMANQEVEYIEEEPKNIPENVRYYATYKSDEYINEQPRKPIQIEIIDHVIVNDNEDVIIDQNKQFEVLDNNFNKNTFVRTGVIQKINKNEVIEYPIIEMRIEEVLQKTIQASSDQSETSSSETILVSSECSSDGENNPNPQNVTNDSKTSNSSKRASKTVYTYDALLISDGRSKNRTKKWGEIREPEVTVDKVAKKKVDSKNQKHSCAECGKVYATSSNLSRHKQTHRSLDSQNAKKCKQCGKAYVSMPALSMHLLTHKLSYTCDICGKLFSRPWLLQGHVRSHTGEKPYGCAHCGKSFADRSNLRAHMQIHTNDKTYECTKCHKTFALKSYLTKHLESSCKDEPVDDSGVSVGILSEFY